MSQQGDRSDRHKQRGDEHRSNRVVRLVFAGAAVPFVAIGEGRAVQFPAHQRVARESREQAEDPPDLAFLAVHREGDYFDIRRNDKVGPSVVAKPQRPESDQQKKRDRSEKPTPMEFLDERHAHCHAHQDAGNAHDQQVPLALAHAADPGDSVISKRPIGENRASGELGRRVRNGEVLPAMDEFIVAEIEVNRALDVKADGLLHD